MIITIDGTSGSGKSTIASLVSKKLGVKILNTGSLYRWVTHHCILENIDISDHSRVVETAYKCDFDGLEIDILHCEEISKNVPTIAAIPEVRKIVKQYQRDYSDKNDFVIEGRDTGSVVFPHADLKFFVTASAEERGKRRFKQLKEAGDNVSLEEIIKNIEERDSKDKSRDISPLIVPEGAVEVDTTDKTINEAMDVIYKICKNFLDNQDADN